MVVGAAMFVGLGLADRPRVAGLVGTPVPGSTPSDSSVLGSAIFHTYVLPFEAVSFLLLAALIGAIVLVAQGRGELTWCGCRSC